MKRKKETKLINKLEHEVHFGDLVEVVLRKNQDFSASHDPEERVIQSSSEKTNEYGIVSVCGYYGGIKSFDQHLTKLKEEILCLNPTVHRADAIKELHCTGEGYIKLPLSAILSYKILSIERRGLRVVN